MQQLNSFDLIQRLEFPNLYNSSERFQVAMSTVAVHNKQPQPHIPMALPSAQRIACFACLVIAHAAAQQWPSLCANGSDAWSSTRCPSSATCCSNAFSFSGKGCCPWPNAVCCPAGYQCCPQSTTCVLKSGSSYNAVYDCTKADGTVVSTDDAVCKPGVTRPMSPTLKNVLVIGDSLSIGYTPHLAAALADVADVQHAPADTADGGAEVSCSSCTVATHI